MKFFALAALLSTVSAEVHGADCTANGAADCATDGTQCCADWTDNDANATAQSTCQTNATADAAVIDGASTSAAGADNVAYVCQSPSDAAAASGAALKVTAVAILAASYFMA